MTYTPRPWVVIDIRDIGKELLEICTLKEGEPVCVARIDHRNNKLEIDKEDEANADLIASAPEMLEMLEKIIEDSPPMDGRNICPMCLRNLDSSPHKAWCWWGEAVEAIKKARGEE